jgi:subtilisin family serine protease
MKSIPVSFVCLLLFLCSAWDGLRAQGLVSPEYLADAVVLDSRVKAAAGPAGAQVEERLLKTKQKYPLLRVEERSESVGGKRSVVSRTASVADHLMVKPRPGAAEAEVLADLGIPGAKVRKKMPASGVWLVSFPVSGVTGFSQALDAGKRARKAVFYAESDDVVTTNVVPNDPSFSQLWGLRNTGQSGGVAGVDIRATNAWETDGDTGSLNVKVGVIDTGIDHTHPDLADNIWVNPNEIAGNGIDDDGNGYIDDVRGWNFYNDTNNAMDLGGHGTHVAGTIGGRGNNGVGVAGVCWRVSLVPLKFLGPNGGTTSDAVEAVAYATSIGVHLTNNSWGGGGYSQALKDVIDAAHTAGILFVAAAGNESNNNDLSPSYPGSFTSPNIISVASITRSGGLSWFSNYGLTSVDVGAPGSDIYSTVPGGGYASLSGTSMASPHVAGLCALIKSQKPGMTHIEIRDAVLRTARPLASLNGNTVTGGLIDAEAAVNSELVVSHLSAPFSGPVGGPFTPAARTFTVTNNGAAPMVWSVDQVPVWLDVSATGGTLAVGASATVTVSLNSQAATRKVGRHVAELRFLNVGDGETRLRQVGLLCGGPEFFTELFSSADNDTDNRSFNFLPQDSASGYTVRRSNLTSFPVDPTGGTPLDFGDDESVNVDLADGKQVQLYGTAYSGFYIGSNGYITFTTGDSEPTPSFDAHFALPRVAALMADLDPSAGGAVSWKQMPDRAVVTWSGVPSYGSSDSNSFQIELFFDGRIRITLLALGNSGGLIGLSFGGGTPANLVESNFAAYPLNQPPTISAIPNQSINEGTATGELSFTVGDSETAAAALTVTAAAQNSALVPADGLILGGAGANRTLRVAPSPTGTGSTQILVSVADELGASVSASFALTVNAQAPVINPVANVLLLEDAPIAPVALTGIRSGNPAAPLALTVTAASSRADLLADPVVQYATGGTEATLLLNPTFAGAGIALVTVTVSDGRLENGTTTTTFQVELRLRNYAPSFRGGGDQVVLEDSALQSVSLWATEISPGRASEAGQAVTFDLSHNAPGLFIVEPALSSSGTLTYQAAPDVSGTATVQVRLRDNGGTSDGGTDTSAPQTLRIIVNPVNDAPSFAPGSDVNVPLGTAAYSLPGWAALVRAGPPDESGQGLTFVVDAADKSLFSVQPAVSSAGTLTFTPAPKVSGDTVVYIRLEDTGGTDFGGVPATSTTQFKIAITTNANQTGEFNGLIEPLVLPATGTQHLGLAKITIARGGAFTGNLRLGGANYAIRGKFDESGVARFGKTNEPQLTILRKGLPPLVVALQVDVVNGTGKLLGTIAEGGAPVASIQTDRLLYTAAKALKAPYRNVPADVLGVSTVAFAPAASLPPTAFPQGHGIGVLTVAASGRATLVGKLADGSAMSYSNAVSVGKKFPVYLTYSLPKGAVGTLSGWVPLDNPTAQDDFEATLRWLRPATASPTYPEGWPTGIPLQLQGSRWLAKGSSGQPMRFPMLKPANFSGNVVFRFTEGLLPGTGFETSANVNPYNAVIPLAYNPQSLSRASIGATGLFSGSFLHPVTGRKPRFEAVILQKRQRAVGFFTTPGVSGRVEVAPR